MPHQRLWISSEYVFAATDRDCNELDGGKNYKLHFPPNVPANDFWTLAVYDSQTRTLLRTRETGPIKNSRRDNVAMCTDGSIDLYYGPNAPAGKEANWTKTVPGRGWYAILRLYGPKQAWFDKTWRPGEFALVGQRIRAEEGA